MSDRQWPALPRPWETATTSEWPPELEALVASMPLIRCPKDQLPFTIPNMLRNDGPDAGG